MTLKTKTMDFLEQAKKCADHAYKQMKLDAPMGSRVRWEHGAQERWGEVVDHDGGHDLRLKVRSMASGKEMWIGFYRVEEIQLRKRSSAKWT